MAMLFPIQWNEPFGLVTCGTPVLAMPGGSVQEACRALEKETSGKIEIWPYEWVPKTPEEFAAQAARARSLGAKHILFWEGDYFDDPEAPAREALAAAMSAQATP